MNNGIENRHIEEGDNVTFKSCFLILLGMSLIFSLLLCIPYFIKESRGGEEPPAVRKSYKEVFSAEECRRMGIIRESGSTDFIPLPDVKERFQKVLQEGNSEDELIERLSEEDYHDILDYMGGPEGF